MDSKRHGEAPVAVNEALNAQIRLWAKRSRGKKARSAAVRKIARSLGGKIATRLQTSLMMSKVDRRWINEILHDVEEYAQALHAAGMTADSLFALSFSSDIAHRFESLEFEERITEEKRERIRLENKVEKLERRISELA